MDPKHNSLPGTDIQSDITALAGGALAAPPAPVAPPARKAFGQRVNTGAGPGTVPRPANLATPPQRSLGGFAVPSANEIVHLQRIEKIRTTVTDLVTRTDKAVATIKALVKELRGANGGAETAARMTLDLETADDLCLALQEALDKHLPPADA